MKIYIGEYMQRFHVDEKLAGSMKVPIHAECSTFGRYAVSPTRERQQLRAKPTS